MTKHLPNVSPKNELHSMTDKDFDTWLDTFPAIDTPSLIEQYKKYAAECLAEKKELLLFSEWREKNGH